MMTDRDLFNAITNTALAGCNADVSARRNTIWLAATTLMADVLREADPFTRERLLQRLVPELRDTITHLSELLSPKDAA
jgi:hypothetical protein